MKGNFIQKQDHKYQITNCILNSKRELLKFRIFSLQVQKRNYNYCLFLKFIIFIYLKYIYINYNRCKLSIFAQKNRRVLYIREFSPLSIGLLCGSKIPSLMKGNFIQKQDHKCQKTNFILNSKRELLKFRIFFPSRSKKKLQLLLDSHQKKKKLQLLFISKIYHFYLFKK